MQSKLTPNKSKISIWEKSEYFMSGPEGVQTIQKLKYKLVEDMIKGFLVTWQNINWIGFSRRCKF